MPFKFYADNFNLKDVFECGQCFRWNKNPDGSYFGVVSHSILCAKQNKNEITISVIEGENLSNDFLEKYFDLNRDYKEITTTLSKVDNSLKTAVEYGSGIRILNQDLWEMIISFIISANNNIPRIKSTIDKMSKAYGKKIKDEYYSFPTPEELSKASVSDLRSLGLGFRDKRIYDVTKLIYNEEFDLDSLYNLNTQDAREKLMTLPGVGPKVADCILLFSDLKRLDVFPIDVWVKKVMSELYGTNPANPKEIQKVADEKFGSLQGIAQQYLFYWKRDS